MTSQRREQRVEREVLAARERRRANSSLGTYGERPPGPFGGLPISELAIFAGAVGLVVGWLEHNGVPLLVGLAVCVLGVVEVTAREHFSGYRSHSTLLAAIPTVVLVTAVWVAIGQPRNRALVVVAAAPFFALVLWLLRKRFQAARQRRVASPPAPPGG